MINPTSYYRPASLQEALHHLAHEKSVALSGGGFLLGGVRLPFSTVVDVQAISELNTIDRHHGLTIGGGVSLADVISQPYLMPALRHALVRTLPMNFLSRVSIGESLSIANPPAEWLSMLAAIGAVVEHYGYDKSSVAQGQPSKDPIVDFVQEIAQRGYPYWGLVKAIHIPQYAIPIFVGAAQVARTPADPPIVNMAVLISIAQAESVAFTRVVGSGIGKFPVHLIDISELHGQPFNAQAIAAVAQTIDVKVAPLSDYQGSVAYRRAMAQVLLQRALEDCLRQVESQM